MAIAAFKQNFSNKLLDRLETEMRRSVEKQRGQLLIIPGPAELKSAVADTFGGQIKISDHHYTQAVKAARTHAKKLEGLFQGKNSKRYDVIVDVVKKNRMGLPPSFQLGVNMFIVTSFRYSITAVKNTMLKYFVTKKLLTDSQKKELSRNVHKGHGARGAAVSQVEVASAIAAIPLEYADELAEAFQAYTEKADIPSNIRTEIESLFAKHTQIVTPDGKLKDDYVSSVIFQLGKTNIGKDATFEKKIKKVFRDFANDYAENLVNQTGSSSLKQKITKVVVGKFDAKKGLIVTSKDKNVSLKTKHKTKEKGTKQKIKTPKVSKGGTKPGRVTFGSKSSSTPLALIQAFNAKLPRKIAENMNSPALNYRTGRFAESVRVTDVVTTPQGFPSFGYTYMKGPYQTFEPGFAQGSVDRDPRRLIDRSMREIAAEFAIGRFYTRRV